MNFLPPGVDPSKIPLAPNPNGQPPNFVDPPSLGPTYLAAGVALLIISTFCVIVRLLTNGKALGKLGPDDCFCVAAQVFTVAYFALYYDTIQDFGKHLWDLPVTVLSNKTYVKKTAAEAIIQAPMYWLSRAAVLLFYLRIFYPNRWLRITSYILLVATFGIYASNIAVICTYCLSGQGQGNSAAFARCDKAAPNAVVIGVLSTFTDIILFAMPFPIILNLQLERRKKQGLVIVFALGFLVVVASAVSLVYRVRVVHGQDPFWNFSKVALTSVAEVFGTIIVSCLPALSACWTNIVTKTKLYSTFRSKFSSRTLVTRSSKSRGINSIGDKNNGWQHSPQHKYGMSHDHWDQVLEEPKIPRTHIYSSPSTKIPVRHGIAKSTFLEQTSNRSLECLAHAT